MSKEVTTQITKESSHSQETTNAVSVALSLGVEFGGTSASTSVTSSQEKTIGQSMSESFSRGETDTDTSSYSFSPTQQESFNIKAVWQWVAKTTIKSTGEQVLIRSNSYACTSVGDAPTSLPDSNEALNSCSGGLRVSSAPQSAPVNQQTPSTTYVFRMIFTQNLDVLIYVMGDNQVVTILPDGTHQAPPVSG